MKIRGGIYFEGRMNFIVEVALEVIVKATLVPIARKRAVLKNFIDLGAE